MANAPEKKKFTERLRDIFRRKAPKPPVPAEIINDKRVQKAVFKNHRRKRWKQIRNIAIASTALTALTHMAPDFVSKPYDQFMAEKGYTVSSQELFQAENIRVYNRGNLLYPFHAAGNETVISWQELDREGFGTFSKAVTAPFSYISGFTGAVGNMISPSLVDAYSISNSGPAKDRTVFIRPPSDFTVGEFLREFAGVNPAQAEYRFQHENKDIERVLFEYVMLHEGRHGDQSKSANGTLNEADADQYAFDVLTRNGTDPALLEEVRTIITFGRILASVQGGGTTHATGFALMRPLRTTYDAHTDAATFRTLHNMLDDVARTNEEAFKDDVSMANRYVYAAAALKRDNVFSDNARLANANAYYMMAVNYFQVASNTALYDPQFPLQSIKTDYLKQNYDPAERPTKRPEPRPPRPNS